LEASLAQVHAGAVDVLVGTQMIAKGHDFRRITLVAAINPDAALFSSDFRAPERLFSAAHAIGRPRRARRRPGRCQRFGQRDVDPDLPPGASHCSRRSRNTTTRRSPRVN
jgi:primosomal protein N' (replication factor Y)